MKLIHSKLSPQGKTAKVKIKPETEQERFNREMDYKFFKKACKENAEIIAYIQEYIPDWEPQFNY